MRRLLLRFLSDERGAAGAEMAISAPLWAMFIMGIAGLAALVYAHLAVITAAADCAVTSSQSDHLVPLAVVDSDYGLRITSAESPGNCSASLKTENWIGWAPHSVNYQFIFPRQAYRSDWSGVCAGGGCP
jgi:Flp pilus assembly pilin Flp